MPKRKQPAAPAIVVDAPEQQLGSGQDRESFAKDLAAQRLSEKGSMAPG